MGISLVGKNFLDKINHVECPVECIAGKIMHRRSGYKSDHTACFQANRRGGGPVLFLAAVHMNVGIIGRIKGFDYLTINSLRTIRLRQAQTTEDQQKCRKIYAGAFKNSVHVRLQKLIIQRVKSNRLLATYQ